MSSIIHDLPETENHPLGLHCIISIAERWTSCWIVPLGGPSLRDGLRSFDKASAHCLGNGFDARLDAKLLVDMTKMRLDCIWGKMKPLRESPNARSSITNRKWIFT